MLKKIFPALFVVFVLFYFAVPAAASESVESESEQEGQAQLDEYDFRDIQSYLDTQFPEQSISFSDMVLELFSGNVEESFRMLFSYLKQALTAELSANMSGIVKILALAIFAAVLANFASAFKNAQIANSALWVVYIISASMLSGIFVINVSIAYSFLDRLNAFVRVLIPTYSVSIAVVKGAAASVAYYEVLLFATSAIFLLLQYIILPLVQIYFVLSVINQIAAEDVLSKTTELLETMISWALKTLFALVIGLQLVQGLIVPAASSLKHGIFGKAMSALPLIGGGIESASQIVLGAGVLIKNGIGVAGMLIILLITAIPAIKLLLVTLIYQLVSAVIQPIADEHFVEIVSTMSKSVKLLLKCVCISMLCILVSIAVVCGFTGIG